MRKVRSSNGFQLSVAERGIVWIRNNHWLETEWDRSDEVGEEYARTVHARKQDERNHRNMNRRS